MPASRDTVVTFGGERLSLSGPWRLRGSEVKRQRYGRGLKPLRPHLGQSESHEREDGEGPESTPSVSTASEDQKLRGTRGRRGLTPPRPFLGSRKNHATGGA